MGNHWQPGATSYSKGKTSFPLTINKIAWELIIIL